jgi:hypothetical protein
MRTPLASATLFAALLAVSVTPRAAHAQFGGFIKRKIAEKVVDKAAEKVDEKAPGKDSSAANANATGGQRRGRAGRLTMAPTNDPSALGSELTADTLERVLRGMEVIATRIREADEARAKAADVDRKLADLRASHAAEIEAWNQRAGKVRECQEGELRQISRARSAEVDRHSKADPAFRERASAAWNKYMPAANAAMAKGDSATVTRLQLELYRTILGVDFDVRKDTAAAVRKCGALPVKIAVVSQNDSLSRLSSELNNRYRQGQMGATGEATERSGLTEQQFFRLRERIERWYVTKAKGGPHFWTDREDALLETQRARIEPMMVAFGLKE